MENRYRKLTESIHTPAGLNDRVLFEARRRAAEEAPVSRRERRGWGRPETAYAAAAAVPRNWTRTLWRTAVCAVCALALLLGGGPALSALLLLGLLILLAALSGLSLLGGGGLALRARLLLLRRGGRRLPGGSRRGGLRLLIGLLEDDLDVGDGVILGQAVKDDGELPVRQHLHVVLRGRAVLGQDLRNGLGGEAEVLRHLVDSVFFNSQIKPLFLFPPPAPPPRKKAPEKSGKSKKRTNFRANRRYFNIFVNFLQYFDHFTVEIFLDLDYNESRKSKEGPKC